MGDRATVDYLPKSRPPDVSLVIPCYNEAALIRNTAVRLVQCFREKKLNVELVLVDNGSADKTGEIIDRLMDEGLSVVKETLGVNEGYGNGVLRGLRSCRGNMVGFMCADGQVDAQDVAKLCELAFHATTPKLYKVRRRFRMEGLLRRIVSSAYNLITTALFGDLGSMDINANPKILPREYLERLGLQSKDWFLDAEVMIKARRIGLDIFELNVLGQMRAEGASKVRAATAWEFAVNLLKYRFGRAGKTLQVQSLEPANRARGSIDET